MSEPNESSSASVAASEPSESAALQPSPSREAPARAPAAPPDAGRAEALLSGKASPLIALGIAAAFLAAPIGKSGIWDPFELTVADLSRRIAVNVFGAAKLVIEGAENGMPRLGDLGRNELPFDSIAMGFRLFGLHEWSGRLPLAVWGILGAMSLYWFLARLVDRRAALYGTAVLSTMPLYFLQARTMLGDIVTMSAITMAFSGLGIATFDRRPGGWQRWAAALLGVFGLAAGFMSRGALIGVALPALGIGLTWGVTCAAMHREGELFGDIAGALSFLVGAVFTAIGVSALFRASSSEYSVLVGTQIAVQSKFPTFELVIHYLGHSLFPWSAFIPFAVGRLLREPAIAATSPEERAQETRESHARLALLVGSGVAFGVYSLMAPKTAVLAYGAPALLAAIAAVSIRDFERGAPASRAVGVGVAILIALFLRDYNMFPEKGLSAFAVSASTFPESFKDQAGSLILLGSGIYVLIFFFSWLERENSPSFRWQEYAVWPRSLARAWDGNLLIGLVAIEIGLILLALGVYVGLHFVHSKTIVQMGLQTRVAFLNGFWCAPAALFGVVWGAMALRDGFRWFFDKTGVTRGMAAAFAGVLVGGILSFGYYPALAAQLSPKEVFESYGRLHRGDEPLGLLGVGGKSSSYYSGSEVKMFSDAQSAFSWLTASTSRRWLAVRNEDIAKLNSLYRGRPGANKENLPVLDGRSSQILLVSNVLAPGEKNENPFESMVLGHEPAIANRVEANLQDQLLSLGWDVYDGDAKRVDYVVPGRKYHFRLYYKVLAPIAGEWETFIHIDGFHRRFNGDHKTLGNKYAFSLWLPGDYIVDDYEFSLEPNFTPGSYTIYYGLYVGETRLKVKTGKQDDNRVEGGQLRVQ